MRWFSLLLVVLGGPAYSIDAHACTCSVAGGYPEDGAADVPVDAELAMQLADDTGRPVLRASDGEEVPARALGEPGILGSTWYRVAPLAPLEAHADYQLAAAQRTVRFSTGAGTAADPVPAEVIELSAIHSDIGACEAGLCGPAGDLHAIGIRYLPSPDAAYYDVILSHDGAAWRHRVGADFGGLLTDSFCGGAPAVEPGQRWCAELIAVGASGGRAAAGAIACAEVRACENDCTGDSVYACLGGDSPWGPVGEPGDIEERGCSVSGRGRAPAGWVLLLIMVGPLARSRLAG